ncbi:helix-turn-helix domain-containing protein [Labrys sp. (in: a-proteobacteria)]|uniref:helix-turn-helix domain-containing protein n=1 Tax=Labrys sp. (in: a-proteobacteria) TaxID=1917972 RepID=UPI0039E6DB01
MPQNRTIADRIKERLTDLGLDPTPTSKAAGLSDSAIRNILEGKSKSPRGQTVRAIARALDTTSEWLEEERGPKEAPRAEAQDEIALAPIDRPERYSMPQDIPVYGTAAGAYVDEFQGFSLEGDVIEYVRRPPALMGVKDVYAIYVVEDSMFPEHKSGELRFVHARKPARPGDSVIIQTRGSEHGELKSFIKNFVRRKPDGTIVASQLNPAMEMSFAPATILHVHRVLTMNELFGI